MQVSRVGVVTDSLSSSGDEGESGWSSDLVGLEWSLRGGAGAPMASKAESHCFCSKSAAHDLVDPGPRIARLAREPATRVVAAALAELARCSGGVFSIDCWVCSKSVARVPVGGWGITTKQTALA